MGFLHRVRARQAQPGALLLGGHGFPEGGLSARRLDERVARAAGWLRSRGLGPGDVLALQTERDPVFLELFLAALGLGVVALPLNPAYPPPELRWYLDDARAALAVVLEPGAMEGRPAVDARALRAELDAAEALDLDGLPEPDEEALAVLLYTSGTTGRPKGACISHRNLRGTVEALHRAWGWRRDDHLLHALPLFHVHGLFVAQLGALWAGARTTWLPRFEAAEAMGALETLGCTVFMGVPTFYHRFLQLPEAVRPRLRRMRLFTSGSAPLPAEDHAAFAARFGHTILERYGMTEVGIVLSNPLRGERRPGAVGFPLPGVEARVVDRGTEEPVGSGVVGEIWIRGPGVISGYLRRPDKTREALTADGWMRTGDLGFVDPEGYFHISGRAKDLVISGGLNVYPGEVEAVLRAWPGVAEAAVVGLPDPDWGERVVAAVVLAEGAVLDEAALVAACRQQLAPYKCPKAVVAVTALPRNAMGKVQKHLLREVLQHRATRAEAPDG